MKKGIFYFLFTPFMLLAINVLYPGCQPPAPTSSSENIIFPSDSGFVYIGRFDHSDPGKADFGWSGSEIRCVFEGSFCRLLLDNYSQGQDPDHTPKHNYYRVQIDDHEPLILMAENDRHDYLLAENLAEGLHTLSIFKRTEAEAGRGSFKGLVLDKGKKLRTENLLKPRRIEFIGNSITCGYGNEGDSQQCDFSCATENAWEAFGTIAARKLNAEATLVCFSGRGVIQNYDRSTTGTMPQLYDLIYPQNDTLTWSWKETAPDLVVINLGTNDFAHKNPERADFINQYSDFLRRLKSNYPRTPMVCLSGPMMTNGNGRKPLATLGEYLEEVIEGLKQEGMMDIFQYGLTTQGKLGYGCDWHPNIAQHQLNGEELAAYIAENIFN